MKAMKRHIAYIVVLVIIFTLAIPVFAHGNRQEIHSDTECLLEGSQNHEYIHFAKVAASSTNSVTTITTKKLLDLNGNYFELVETGECGYLIFDPQSGKYLEEALDSPSPYLGLDHDLYYLGPLNYYQLKDGAYVHTLFPEGNSISSDVAKAIQTGFDVSLQRSRSQPDSRILDEVQGSPSSVRQLDLQEYFSTMRATNEYIQDYGYIKDAVFPKNQGNTCGYVAACLILNYWHNHERPIIDDSFLDSDGNLKKDGYTLQDKLLSYGDSDTSWGKTIRDALIAYCKEYGVSASSTYYVTNYDIAAEVSRGRPIILFGNFPENPGEVPTRGSLNHAVTAYGVSSSGLFKKFIVHYGWPGYGHVTLDGGLVGSSTQFILN